MKILTPEQAFDHIFDNNLTDLQCVDVVEKPDGISSAKLLMASLRLSEASEAAHGKGAGPERQLFERLMDENPIGDERKEIE